ncbi:MAG: SUMF1/EgtB/PvdO family nonheme iron enzyme [Flavobacteriaceae bacterium]|nr:SUMF1/EgtB/PvdO family nonheme iron enzyme [Flavobacteriaceae bacterium]
MRAFRVVLIVTLMMGFLLSCGLFDAIFPPQNQHRKDAATQRGKLKTPEPEPPGTTQIMGGSLTIRGMNELGDYNQRTVSVPTFHMDETEVSNRTYRQFVKWVRDSIARELLARKVLELGANNQSEGIGQFAFQGISDVDSLSEYQQHLIKQYGEDFPGTYKLNWDAPLTWDFNKYPDQYYAQILLDSFYLHPSKWTTELPKLDVKKFKYRYPTNRRDLSSHNATNSDTFLNLEPFIPKEDIEVYPDTAVWIKDFNYSYNEPMHYNYFWHPTYDEYPVVGVNWHQANAFCAWRTQKENSDLSVGKQDIPKFRLPTEIEWEYAARVGQPDSIIYPWGTNQLLDHENNFLANFKPVRDEGRYTVRVKSYKSKNDLYNMAGNVAEWTLTTFVLNDKESFTPSPNPNINVTTDERKVIKGGSWKDVASYLEISSRDFEYANIARSFIGFRTVQHYPKYYPNTSAKKDTMP